MNSIRFKFSFTLGIIMILFSALLTYRVYLITNEYVRTNLSTQTKLALNFDLAIRKYAAEHIRPIMYKFLGKDVFIRETMSTSYIARNIFHDVCKKFPGYIIKFSSDNPRNPINKAGSRELKMIKYFNDHPGITEWHGEITINGQRFLAEFRPRRLRKSCLHCHGNPMNAPKSLIEQYGDKAGFYRRVGKVIALDTVAIPVEKIEGKFKAELVPNLVVLGAFVTFLFIAIYLASRFLVTEPLYCIANHFEEEVKKINHEKLEQIKINRNDEIGAIVSSFNMLVSKLNDYHATLEEKTRERTKRLKLAEHRQQQSERRFKTLIENSMFGLSIMKPDNTFEYFNPKFTELFGYALEDIPTEEEWFKKAYPDEEYREKVKQIWVKDLRTEKAVGKIVERIFTVKCKDGTEKIVHFKNMILDDDRHITTYDDVTQTKQLEAQLQQAQKMEAIGILAGGVAHDFNNLLTTIRGFTQLALLDLRQHDLDLSNLEEVIKASERASNLTRQLLLFSRRQPMKFGNMDLNKTIYDVLKMLSRLIGEDISIKTDLASDLWTIKADRGNLEQMIMNLAVNSKDAMPQGGEIYIKTFNVIINENYRKKYSYAKQGQYVCLQFSDTGSGIDARIIDRIFEPFFTTKGLASGTGLGLSVVYGIIKEHKGWINVDSQLNKGTVFEIYLPAARDIPTCETTQRNNAIQYWGKGEKILIVEDEKSVRRFASKALKDRGYNVIVAETGEEALKIFEKEKIELVFTDVVLPDFNGLKLAERFVEMDPNIRILLTSGYTDEKSQWSIIRRKGFDFLEKPYNVTTLLRVFRKILD